MYSKVVYDYFNSNPKKFKFKPNKLTRTNAFKKKATKKTVVMPQKSNTPTKIQKTSSTEDAAQKTMQPVENRSTVSVVYDTVQYLWKYAKSFISNQNSDSNKHQERSRKKIKYRTNSRNTNLNSLRSVPHADKETNTDETITGGNISQGTEDEIMEEDVQHDENVDKDIYTKTSTNIQALKSESLEKIHFENPETNTVCSEELTSKNCDHITNNTSCKISIKRNKPKNTIKDLYIKQNLQNKDQPLSEKLNVVEVQILKSSLKTYGRGKRKNKKLHVHFKDENDLEKRKYSAYTAKKLRKSDCCHPNAFFKILTNKHTPDKKKNTHNRGKKRRLAICTKSSKLSLKKKRPKRNSSSNISLQSKSSDYYENKVGKKTRKAPKKYSVYATTKIYKKKRGKNCKRATANEKGIRALKDIVKTINDPKFDESVNDTKPEVKAAGDEQLNKTSFENNSIDNGIM